MEIMEKRVDYLEDSVLPNIPHIAAKYFKQKTLSMVAPRIRKEHPQKPGDIKEFDIIAIQYFCSHFRAFRVFRSL